MDRQMKKLIGALLAAAAIGAVSSPALAHPDDDDEDNVPNGQYSQYFGGYQNFDALYQHDWQGIRHGLSDGSYTPREARYFAGQLQDIRRREAYFRSRDGWLSPQEGRDIQFRLERLHEVMHRAHEDGHAAQDDWNNTSPGYGGDDRPYNNGRYYYQRR
jgi:opacity protein-like surface antigen